MGSDIIGGIISRLYTERGGPVTGRTGMMQRKEKGLVPVLAKKGWVQRPGRRWGLGESRAHPRGKAGPRALMLVGVEL